MAHSLQKKFAKGCNYNMKLVIRGDKNTGKSCLLARLQGGPFREEYCPTEEIQVASVNWSYKNTEDIVKVEVWDVVDVAKKRKKLTGLKVGAGSESEEFEPGLDAQFLDVYKQTHGVIFIFDITKPWTFEYAKKELDRVPGSIPVLVLASFSDMSHHRQISKLQIADFVENVKRHGDEPAEVRWAECSLRNGFGLKFLHKFFNVPFLTLQRQSLLQQLDQNLKEIQATHDELDLFMDSAEADYSQFSQGMAHKRRQAAEEVAPLATRSIVVGQSSNSVVEPPPISETSLPISFSNRASQPGQLPVEHSGQQQPVTPSTLTVASAPNLEVAKAPPVVAKSYNASTNRVDVESFVPETRSDFDSFLDDETSAGSNSGLGNNILDSSDDEADGNPMVSKFDEDVVFEAYHVDQDTNSSPQHETITKPHLAISESPHYLDSAIGDSVSPQIQEYNPL